LNQAFITERDRYEFSHPWGRGEPPGYYGESNKLQKDMSKKQQGKKGKKGKKKIFFY